jgi:predicted DCC family thiol-disulfide oxidoreductase YuxK
VRRIVEQIRARARAVAKAWDGFFFTPSDPTTLGLIRLVTGMLLLWSLAVTGGRLRSVVGSDGWLDPALARRMLGATGWSLWLWVPDDYLGLVWVLGMTVTAMFAVGLGSRLTAVLAWAFAVSTATRAPVMTFGFDAIITTWAFCLAVTGASGQAVSLDRVISRYREARRQTAKRRADGRWTCATGVPTPTISANITLRLFQLYLCLIYLTAGLGKLQAAAWWDGSAVGKLLGNAEFRPVDLTWLAGARGVETAINLATHLTVAFELGYPIFIWRRAWRPFLLTGAFVLHLGIGLTLGLYEFMFAMLVGNLAFVSGTWLRGVVTSGAQPRGRVLYDGACPRCRGSMAALTALDPDHVLEPVDLTVVDVTKEHPSLTKEACMRAMHVVRSDGKVVAGYDAVMTLLRWLPLTWLPSLVGRVPGMTWLGRRVYNRIAASRFRDVPCTDEVCGIHGSHSRQEASVPAESGRTSR